MKMLKQKYEADVINNYLIPSHGSYQHRHCHLYIGMTGVRKQYRMKSSNYRPEEATIEGCSSILDKAPGVEPDQELCDGGHGTPQDAAEGYPHITEEHSQQDQEAQEGVVHKNSLDSKVLLTVLE